MRNKVLIVDDIELNREILTEILEDEYEVLEAGNGEEGIALLEKHKDEIAVMLLDLLMPKVDGFAVLEVMKQKDLLQSIPVLVISGEDSVKVEKRCFECGVRDFIRKPFDNTLVKKRVNNVTELYLYKSKLEKQIDHQTETLRKQYKLLLLQAEKLKKSNETIIDVLGEVVEHRNLESGEHIKRVKSYTGILAGELMRRYPEYGLTEEEIRIIVSASALHDVGKITIPDSILLKPAKLTTEEFEYIKSHTIRGCEILESIKGVWDEKYAKKDWEICRYHHERYDGKGYPEGLVGEEIPVSAQIVAVADVYDALVSERVYKSAYTPEQAYYMIMNGECGMFSPKLMECFRAVRKEMEAQKGQ